MKRTRLAFPFSAIVGLDKLKLAILINAVNPKIGGLLIRGAKGSGKSTTVRALADILPKIQVVKNCPFNCNPRDPSNMCPKCSASYMKNQKLPIEERDMVVVDLPLGATEDRVVGSLDVEKAIKLGIEALESGILADVNQNILYVDEVNLLPDHIADDLLDAAATGWNIVEREGISVSHPSRFVFIGTMNPEEGELRPQLLDRFSISVNVDRIASVNDRVEVVKRNMKFEAEPEGFLKDHEPLQQELRERIAKAGKRLKEVTIPDSVLASVCAACLELEVDGLRPDIVIAKAASTLAALEDRNEVELADILVAAELALSHRTRKGGFMEPASPQEITEIFKAKASKIFKFEKTGEKTGNEMKKSRLLKGRSIFKIMRDATETEEEKAQKKNLLNKIRRKQIGLQFLINRLLGGLLFGFGKRMKKSPEDAPSTESIQIGTKKLKGETLSESAEDKKAGVKTIPTVSDTAMNLMVSEGFPLLSNIKRKVVSPSTFYLRMGKTKSRKQSTVPGKRAHSTTTVHRGKPYGWQLPSAKPRDIHFPATIREAARRQRNRERTPHTALSIHIQDVREKLRLYKAPLTMIFVVDLSGSMLLNMDAVKEALLKLHRDAYRYRDRVGVVALKDTGAVVVQHPITNLRVVASKLVAMRVSGFTPLAAGMLKAREVLREAKRRDLSTVPAMIIITDGSANVPLSRSLDTGEIRQIDRANIIFRKYEDLAVEDVMCVSKLIKREGIHTVAVNTNPRIYGRESYGLLMTEIIASITKGSHHSIGRLRNKGDLVETMIEKIREDQRRIAQDEFLN